MTSSMQRHEVWVVQKPILNAQISSLRAAYHKLASRYRSLSLLLRRDVQLEQTDQRFYCAALIQHLPAAFQTTGDGTEEGTQPEPDRTLPAEEVCPVSRSWYSRLVKASEALAAWPNDDYRGSDLSTIKSHILWAKISLYHAEQLLDSIISQLSLTYQAASPIALVKSWNVLCESMKATLPFDAAVNAARENASAEPAFEMPKPPGTVFVRTWFSSEHALSMLLPPAAWLAQLRKTMMPPPSIPRPEASSAGSQERKESTAQPSGSTAGAQVPPRPSTLPVSAITRRSAHTPPATPANPFATQIERLQMYNDRWDSLQPNASFRTLPYPSRTLNLPALDERSNHGLGQTAVMSWTADDHIKVNAAKFWAEGCGVALRVSAATKTTTVQSTNSDESVKALRKQLRMKEASRWHPDTLNRRTGNEEGGIDESIGKRKEMKAIWGALQDLLAQCEKFGE